MKTPRRKRPPKPSRRSPLLNTRMNIPGPDIGCRLRIFKRKGEAKHSPRLLIKCGCCDQSVEIHHDAETLEINGVFASLDEWRRLLDPLLKGRAP